MAAKIAKLKKYFCVTPGMDEPEMFRKMVTVSVTLHIAVLLFFGVKAAIFPHEPIDLDAAIRVDMVGLPDKVAELPEEAAKPKEEPKKAEPKKAEPKPEPKAKPEPKKPAKPEPVVLNQKLKSKTALEKIKKLEREESAKKALENIMSEVNAEDRKAKVEKILKGNVASPGTALHGLLKSEFNEYIGQIHNHIQQHWSLPEWLQNDSLKATVVVHLDYRGVVVKRNIEKSSGDSRFDGYALDAVDKASPFPKPPPKFVDIVRVDGIVLRFPE